MWEGYQDIVTVRFLHRAIGYYVVVNRSNLAFCTFLLRVNIRTRRADRNVYFPGRRGPCSAPTPHDYCICYIAFGDWVLCTQKWGGYPQTLGMQRNVTKCLNCYPAQWAEVGDFQCPKSVPILPLCVTMSLFIMSRFSHQISSGLTTTGEWILLLSSVSLAIMPPKDSEESELLEV